MLTENSLEFVSHKKSFEKREKGNVATRCCFLSYKPSRPISNKEALFLHTWETQTSTSWIPFSVHQLYQIKLSDRWRLFQLTVQFRQTKILNKREKVNNRH
ncbi:hypothetical protein CEXT_813491 [Caerostris extrusa]|uniref:Ycf15 n=1 Tax=Caerostris extrusa TaxID=172846 RepID=A0AAV4U0H5_CAEEX|nr:hypothetical protein CEXT_813491 [Caerostris extrusa]